MSIILSDTELQQLQRLTFASARVSSRGLTGEHRSRRRGLSPEFADYKAYTPGDDFRRIDWNTYARLDHLFIRESETTTEEDIHLFLDTAPGMDWSSDPDLPTKLATAKYLAAILAYIATWHFDRLSLQTFGGDGSRGTWGPRQGRSTILPMLGWLATLPVAPVSEPDMAIRRFVRQRKRSGRLIVLSDFAWADADRLRETLHAASGSLWQSTLILIEDPAEIDPAPLFGDEPHLELEEIGSRSRMQVGSGVEALTAYRVAREVWNKDLDDVARTPGVNLVCIDPDRRASAELLGQLVDAAVLQR